MDLKSIHFPRKAEANFIQSLRARVNDYFRTEEISRYGDSRMAWKTVFMLALYFVPYLLMVTGVFQSFAAILFSWILMGFGMSGIGLSVMHDANHMSYSSSKTVNRYMSLMLNLIGGFSPNWKIQHNTLHHGYTNIDGYDEDIDPGRILRLSPDKPLHGFQRMQYLYAWFLYGLMTLSWVTSRDLTQLLRYKREGLLHLQSKSFNRLIAELIVSKIVYYCYILLIPMLVLPLSWWWVLILFVIMHFISGITLATIFQSAHVVPTSQFPAPDDQGNLKNNWAIHQMLTTANFSPNGRLFSWLIGGLNYQIEHHLFPNICHIHYRKIAPIVRQTASEFGVPYHVQPTFIHAVRNHARMLRQLGRQDAVPRSSL